MRNTYFLENCTHKCGSLRLKKSPQNQVKFLSRVLHLHDVTLYGRCTIVWNLSIGLHEGYAIKTHSTPLRCSCRGAHGMHSSQYEAFVLVTWKGISTDPREQTFTGFLG